MNLSSSIVRVFLIILSYIKKIQVHACILNTTLLWGERIDRVYSIIY